MNEIKYFVVILTAGKNPEIIEKEVSEEDTGMDMYRLAEKTLGYSHAELVHPVGFMGKYGFFVSETSVIDDLPINFYASALYGTEDHHQPICGDAMVIRLANNGNDPELMRKKDTPEVKRMIRASEMRFMTKMNEVFKRYRGEIK